MMLISSLNLHLIYTFCLIFSHFGTPKAKWCVLGAHSTGSSFQVGLFFFPVKALLNATNMICMHAHALTRLLAIHRTFTVC